MAPSKAYFPVPDFDHTPDKLIKLGQIITSPFTPDAALSPPFLPLPETDTTFKDDWEKERTRTLSGSIGIWGKFLAWILTLGADVSVNFEREDADIFKFAKLETSFFVPGQKYIVDAMQSEYIREHLKVYPKTGSLFMITGVKIARGAEITRKKVRGEGGEGDVSVNAMPTTGVPAEAGPKGKLQRKVVDRERFKKSSDFVFAYRLRRITIQRKTGDVSSKDYVRGATVSVGAPKWKGGDESESESESESDEQEEKGPMVFDIFSDEEDFGVGVLPDGYKSEEVKDDDEEGCQVVFRQVTKAESKSVA